VYGINIEIVIKMIRNIKIVITYEMKVDSSRSGVNLPLKRFTTAIRRAEKENKPLIFSYRKLASLLPFKYMNFSYSHKKVDEYRNLTQEEYYLKL